MKLLYTYITTAHYIAINRKLNICTWNRLPQHKSIQNDYEDHVKQNSFIYIKVNSNIVQYAPIRNISPLHTMVSNVNFD